MKHWAGFWGIHTWFRPRGCQFPQHVVLCTVLAAKCRHRLCFLIEVPISPAEWKDEDRESNQLIKNYCSPVVAQEICHIRQSSCVAKTASRVLSFATSFPSCCGLSNLQSMAENCSCYKVLVLLSNKQISTDKLVSEKLNKGTAMLSFQLNVAIQYR